MSVRRVRRRVRRWLRRHLTPARALAVFTAGLVVVTSGAASRLWGYDVRPLLLLGALLALHLAVSAAFWPVSRSRGARAGRRAAAGVRGAPAAASPMPAAVVGSASPGLRGRHRRRPFQLPIRTGTSARRGLGLASPAAAAQVRRERLVSPVRPPMHTHDRVPAVRSCIDLGVPLSTSTRLRVPVIATPGGAPN